MSLAASLEERRRLAPFLPRLVIDWVDAGPDERHRAEEGTVAFVDISGFTKLSETLAQHGKIGAEELSSAIGTCFSHLLDLAYDNGGRLLKFGGDALLLFFTGEGHEVRACRSAFDMRRALRTVGRLTALGHKVSLRMSVGIHSGVFDMFLVGASHRELVITGPAVSATVEMESAAVAGEILVTHQTAAALRPADVGDSKEGGYLLRRGPAVTSEAATLRDEVGPGPALWGCIPGAVRDSVLGASHEPEHRRAVVAFVHFDGIDARLRADGVDHVADYLDRLVTDAQDAVDQQGITFLGTDIDHDGGKLILVAGAPATSGDDEHRMLLALRQLIEADRDPPIRIGVNRGPVFAGEIGPHYRRTFTVMGDTVNLAARLMAKAHSGQILAVPEITGRSRAEFETSDVEPFHVKGKSRPIHAVDVGRRVRVRRGGTVSEVPLIGRRSEMHVWRSMVDATRAGAGGVVEVVGEPGVGKSRLLDEFRSTAATATIVSLGCEPYDSTNPYGALRELLRAALGLEETDPALLAAELGRMAADSVPGLDPWLPLLGPVFDVAIPDTPETAEIEAEFRAARLGEVTSRLLGGVVRDPTVFVVEDAHWMDDASAEVLRLVAGMVPSHPWVLCISRRCQQSGYIPPEEVSIRLALEPLAASEAEELIHVVQQHAPLAAHQTAALVERSGGNPLFLRELLAAAQGTEDVALLPDSVEAVIATRIDRLSSDDRHFLRRLSVLGRTTSRELLAAVIESAPPPEDPIWDRVSEFVSPDRQGQLTFRHALIRDSAYDGLSYRLRRQLHGRAGDAIRASGARSAPELSSTLSYHYLHAARYHEAWTYAREAARRATDLYAHVESAQLYTRALVAARGLRELDDGEVAAVHELLGDAYYSASMYGPAATAYRSARRLGRAEPVAEARLVLKTARVMGRLDRYAGALRWITKGLHALDGVEGPDAAARRADLLAWYGRFCQESGHHTRALMWSRRAVAEAEGAANTEALANALKVLDWAMMDLGTLREPDNWRRALTLFGELGDLASQSTLLNGLGMIAHFRGDWDEALRFYRQSQDMAKRAGDSVLEAFEINNIAEVVLEQGRLDEAEELFTEVARIWRAAGYRSGEGSVKCNLGRIACGRRQFAEAVELFDEAIDGAIRVGGHVEALEARARKAECLLHAGRLADALALAEHGLEQCRLLGGVPSQAPLLHRVRGVALAETGVRDEARTALLRSLHSAHERRAEHEGALTLKVMADHGFSGEPVGVVTS